MTPGDRDIPHLIEAAGFAPGQPVGVAGRGAGGWQIGCAAGHWPDGRAVTSEDRFYAASLSKQLTGAAIALLVRSGRIDPDAEIPQAFLPGWPRRPTIRQVLHHVGGLPAAGAEIEPGRDWTNDVALGQLAVSLPAGTAGSAHVYSNLGYVLLARIVERASEMPFQTFVAEHLIAPLGLVGIGFATEKLPDVPQARMLGPSLPLSTGDGGLWTTASAFADWLDAQNRDALGIASLVEQDYPLNAGGSAHYGWGIGIRTFRGHACFIHGGGWTGARAKAMRCPALGLSVAVVAVDDREDRVNALADACLDALAD